MSKRYKKVLELNRARAFRRRCEAYFRQNNISVPSRKLNALIRQIECALDIPLTTDSRLDRMTRAIEALNGTGLKVELRKATTRQSSKAFYESREWQALRYQALRANDGRCELCGAGKHDGVRLHVDHIMPRSKFPALELEMTNLQILCEPCNMGKGNKDDTDWRAPREPEADWSRLDTWR